MTDSNETLIYTAFPDFTYDEINLLAQAIIAIDNETFSIHDYDSDQQLLDKLQSTESVELDINVDGADQLATKIYQQFGTNAAMRERKSIHEQCPADAKKLAEWFKRNMKELQPGEAQQFQRGDMIFTKDGIDQILSMENADDKLCEIEFNNRLMHSTRGLPSKHASLIDELSPPSDLPNKSISKDTKDNGIV